MAASKQMKPLVSFGKVFWNNQFRVTIDLPKRQHYSNLEDKVAIITGSNTGLGFESARQLLSLGLSRLIIAVRSADKGTSAKTILQKSNPAARIDVWILDMESYESIQSFVKKCDDELTRIDYTVLNAGLAQSKFRTTPPTGHETTIQVNHLSTALLTILIMPVLKEKSSQTCPARLTIVNSLTAHLCKFPNRNIKPLISSFDDTKIVAWDPQERYGVSKLLNQLFIARLCDTVNLENVSVNMVDPGLTKGTNLGRDTSGFLRIAAKLFVYICGRPVDRGAATYLYALMGAGKSSHGGFLMNNTVTPYAGLYYSNEGPMISDRIWEETLSELDFIKPRDILAAL